MGFLPYEEENLHFFGSYFQIMMIFTNLDKIISYGREDEIFR